MVCIYCASGTQVINSRHQKRSNQVWRRRQCRGCASVFTTEETVDFTKSIVVGTPSGSYEPFERDKLLLSVYDALRHRNTAQTDATALTVTIVGKLTAIHVATITSTTIATTAHEVLRRFDSAAAVHYKAFHLP